MKTLKKLSSTLFLLLFAGMAMAQDVIVKNDQTTILSKVIEISSTEIKYKKWSNQDGPTYSISRLEVVKINYENGEVESFNNSTSIQQNKKNTQFQYLNSYMTTSSGWLYLNGRKLSDYEVKTLLDTECYQLYQKGRSQIKTGVILDIIGGAGLLVSCGIRLFNSDLKSNDSSVTKTSAFKTQIAFLTVGGITLGTGIIVGISGGDKTEKVAKTYNQKHGNVYSLNISPSLMRFDTPQSQGNYGLGLTLNVNF